MRDAGGSVRRAIAAIIAAAAGLFAASMLGVAIAEAPTGTPLRTVSVEGVAELPIGQADNAAAATSVYREAMAAAVADGQTKASFLAGKVGAALGPVQTVSEGGGYISCTGAGENGYAEYEGEQPDFGSSPRAVAPLAANAPAVAPAHRTTAPTRAKKRKRRRHKHPTAKAAAVTSVTCKLSTQVSLVYTIS
jgi:hypothetical protein